MQIFRDLIIVAPVVLMLACSSLKVSQDYDTATDFSGLKEFSWQSKTQKKSGDVRVDNPLLDSRIRAAVDRSLAEKGYQKISRGTPQFLVAYQYAIRRKVGSDGNVRTSVGIGVGGSGSFGGIGVSSGGGVSEYDEGILVIDIIDDGNGKLLWRGTGTRRLSHRTGPEELTAEVNETVAKILAQFPPQE